MSPKRQRKDDLAIQLDELDRELGEPTEANYKWADEALGLEE